MLTLGRVHVPQVWFANREYPDVRFRMVVPSDGKVGARRLERLLFREPNSLRYYDEKLQGDQLLRDSEVDIAALLVRCKDCVPWRV